MDTTTLATVKHQEDFSLDVTPVNLWTFQDDGFGIWLGTYNALLWWLSCFNQIHPRMSITHSISTHEVVFMDLTITKGERFKNNGLLDYQVYQKPIARYGYIPFHSFHTQSSKRSFINTELNRYTTHSSSVYSYLKVKQLFYKRLRGRGYPFKFLSPLFKRHSYAIRQKLYDKHKRGLSKQQPLIFKTVNTKRNQSLGLNRFLSEVQSHALMVPTLKKCATQRPILCLKRPNNLSNILRPM